MVATRILVISFPQEIKKTNNAALRLKYCDPWVGDFLELNGRLN